jgi:hypothetical protein
MRVLLLTALLAIPASAASAPDASVRLFSAPEAPVPVVSVPASEKGVINPNQRAELGLCPQTAAQMAADRARKAGGGDLFHKLTELPPANAYVAVFRHDSNGCEAPIVVRYGVGGR